MATIKEFKKVFNELVNNGVEESLAFRAVKDMPGSGNITMGDLKESREDEANRKIQGAKGGSSEKSSVPDVIKNNPDMRDVYNNLSDDEREFINTYVGVLRSGNEQTQETINQALEQAKAQANPYFAEKIRIVQDNLKRAYEGVSEGAETQIERLERDIKRINEDLRTGRSRLSVDEQADLARLKRNYEVKLESLEEEVSSTGLTFSSKRRRARRRLDEEQTDIVESTSREFTRSREDLETKAERGVEDTQGNISEIISETQRRGTDLIRTAEAQLGTKNLPELNTLPGGQPSPLGGVSGEIEETKQRDITTRAGSILNLSNPII